MSVTLTGGSGLFDRIGWIGRLVQDVNQRGETFASDIDSLLAIMGSNYNWISPLTGARESIRLSGTNSCSALARAAAASIVMEMVQADATLPSKDIGSALKELVRQMTAGGNTVLRTTVTGSASAVSGNNGNGAVIVSVISPAGLTLRNLIAETPQLVCTSDSQTGGTSVGSEIFRLAGDPAVADPIDYKWLSGGSGASASVPSTDSLTTGQNLLNNSSWETASLTAFNGWTITTGAFGTDITSGTSQYNRGVKSIHLVGDGSTKSALYQEFNNSSAGTVSQLKPSTSYGVAIACRSDSAPAAGAMVIELVDGNSTVINDDQSTANSSTISFTGLTTSWVYSTAVFRTPKVLPTTQRIRLRLSTAITNAKTVDIDDLVLMPLTEMYPGGPLVGVVAGSSKWALNDSYNLTIANNNAGASYGSTFQTLFNRLFNMQQYRLILPDASSPSISDTLITG